MTICRLESRRVSVLLIQWTLRPRRQAIQVMRPPLVATIAGPPRVYRLCTSRSRCFKSYRMVLSRNLVGEYYGLQGTTWQDPPILRSPSETRTVGGRQYDLHYDGDRLRLVAWRTESGAYWVSNTLLQTLSAKQMMAIATSARTL